MQETQPHTSSSRTPPSINSHNTQLTPSEHTSTALPKRRTAVYHSAGPRRRPVPNANAMYRDLLRATNAKSLGRSSSSKMTRFSLQGPMARRLAGKKVTSAEHLRYVLSSQSHRLQISHQSKVSTGTETQHRMREKAEKIEKERRAARRTVMCRTRELEECVDLTQEAEASIRNSTEREDPNDLISDDEEDTKLKRELSEKASEKKRPVYQSRTQSHTERSTFGLGRWREQNEQKVVRQEKQAVALASNVDKEDVIMLSSDDDDESPLSLKRKRCGSQDKTRLVGLPVSDVVFNPPNIDKKLKDSSDKGVTSNSKLIIKKLPRAKIGAVNKEVPSDLQPIRGKECSDEVMRDGVAGSLPLILKITPVVAYPAELDDVIVLSDDENKRVDHKEAPRKCGMKRVSDRTRPISAKSFYSSKKTNGTKEGNLHIPILRSMRINTRRRKHISYVELSDDDAKLEESANNEVQLRYEYGIDSFILKGGNEGEFEVENEERSRDIRFRMLNAEELAIVLSLTYRVPKQRVLARIEEANIELRGEDFGGLRGSRWLNDEIMNSFVSLINTRNRKNNDDKAEMSEEKRGFESSICSEKNALWRSRPRSHIFNTFFFARLSQNGYDYDGVKRWLKRVGLCIKQLDLILVPINVENYHWVLGGIDLRGKQFIYMDSTFGRDSCNAIGHLRKWLSDEVRDKHGAEEEKEMEISSWAEVINPAYLPRQKDGGSCGIFTLYMADYLERGQRPNFTQKDIMVLRRRTVLFLKEGRLPN